MNFLLLLLICPSICFGYLTTSITSATQSKYLKFVKSQQQTSNFLYGTLPDTYYAAETFEMLGEDAPSSDQTCATLTTNKKKMVKNWETLFYLFTTIARLDCSKGVGGTDELRTKLQSGLSTGKLSTIYYASRTLSMMVEKGIMDGKDISYKEALAKLDQMKDSTGLYKESQDSKKAGSPYKTAMATMILLDVEKISNDEETKAAATKQLEKLKKFVPKLMAEGKKTTSTLSFQDSLTATVYVLEAITSLANRLDDALGVRPAQIDRMARYVIKSANAGSIVATRHVMRAATILAKNRIFNPLVIAIDAPFMVLKSKMEVSVQLSDTLGQALQSNADVNLVVEDKRHAFDKTQDKFSLDVSKVITATKPTTQEVEIEIVPEDSSYNVYSLKKTIVIGKNLKKAELTMFSYTKSYTSVKEADKSKVAFPKTLDDTFELSLSSKIRMEFKLPGLGFEPQLVMVHVTRPDGSEKFNVLPKTKGAKYLNILDISKDTYSNMKSGLHDVFIMIGDKLLAKPILWKVATINVYEIEDDGEEVEEEYEPINDYVPNFKPATEIAHTFAPETPRPNRFIAMLFTAFTLAPLAGLLYALCSLNIAVSLPQSYEEWIFAVGLQLGLALIVLLLGVYWVGLKIFVTIFYACGLGVVITIFGFKSLSFSAKRRVSKK